MITNTIIVFTALTALGYGAYRLLRWAAPGLFREASRPVGWRRVRDAQRSVGAFEPIYEAENHPPLPYGRPLEPERVYKPSDIARRCDLTGLWRAPHDDWRGRVAEGERL